MNRYLIVLIICSFLACSEEKDQTKKRSAPSQSFVTVPSSESGIAFSNMLKPELNLSIIDYLYYYNGGGVAVGDVDGDGLEDIFFTANQGEDKLYRNKGNLQFEDATAQAGIQSNFAWSSGVTMDDVNGDGHLDIYICKVAPLTKDIEAHNLLYINDGTGKFEERSKEFGLDFAGYSTQSCFLDYDKDGDLDMYLLNHTVHSVRSYGNIENRTKTDPLSGDRFYENTVNKNGKFQDVSESSGIYSSPLGYGLAISASDVNGDGWTDLYIGNDFHENDYLYINNGDKTFTESIDAYFTNTSQFSMGVDIADMDNDGDMDIFTTDMMPYDQAVALKSGGEDTDQVKRIKNDLGFEMQNARNHLQINEEKTRFVDRAFMTRTQATDWSWSVLAQDFDNDTDNDIFISNGIVGRPNDLDYINYLNANPAEKSGNAALIDKMPSQPLRNILFTQKAKLEFSDVLDSEIGEQSFSTGAAYADFDRDGDLDIITNNINAEAFLLENTSGSKGNYLSIALSDKENMNLKGTIARVFLGDMTITKELQTVKGFQSSSTHELFFGLGSSTAVDSLVLIWPDNTFTTKKDVKVNQHINILKPKSSEKWQYTSTKLDAPLLLPFVHRENKFYDENVEKLIPERLGYEGPALLVEDLNGDGIVDVYLGGARNQEAKLLLGKSDGSFKNQKALAFDTDREYEDIDAATIDFDGDGDKDIYVVSGGNDNKELDKLLEDRLYLNNGNGEFKRIPVSLPHTNGSCVTVGDLDGDGFDDLFVGASSIPGSYGLSPYSFVLLNKKGQGVDIGYKTRFGMVKDGEWVDVDGDEDLDLVMCGDWMNIRVFKNEKGELTEATEEMGLGNTSGLWNTIEFVDVDADGDKDILAGNAGINSRWSASQTNPMKLIVGDFDKNGSVDPLVFYHTFGRYVPLASMDKLTAQLPMLKKKFTTYDSFTGVSSLEDLIADGASSVVENKQVSELRSMLFILENGKYTGYPLGTAEQLSSINDFAPKSDGTIVYTGNNSTYTAELGASLANPGRRLGSYDALTNSFTNSEDIGLPADFEGRKLGVYLNGQIICVPNGGYPVLLK